MIQKTGSTSAPARLPAADIEKAVRERMIELLNSPVELIDAFYDDQVAFDQSIPGESFVSVAEKASDLAASWVKRSAQDRDLLLKAVIARIVVHSDHVEIQIRVESLIQEITGPRSPDSQVLNSQTSSRMVSINCRFRHVKRGKVLRLIVGNGTLSTDSSRQVILRAIALARSWYLQIVSGEAVSLRTIILRERVDASYAKKIFPLAFLSPAATEAVLRFESDLTLTALLSGVRTNWALQQSP